ncbi:MAG: hypothetical protein M3R46_06165 [Actinomycetota bacterium]|jgi:hypothetical protein|nr:hypothetical protein [Actinomycetota bacterium]
MRLARQRDLLLVDAAALADDLRRSVAARAGAKPASSPAVSGPLSGGADASSAGPALLTRTLGEGERLTTVKLGRLPSLTR